jgi:ubiquinone/menaquinone biosynthesis C-methylase UbiE
VGKKLQRNLGGIVKMKFQFFTDEEYERSFDEFGNIRSKIAAFLKKQIDETPEFIVDVPAGHAYLSAELAQVFQESQILAIGLPNDYMTHTYLRKSDAYPHGLWSRVQYLISDAICLPLANETCDTVANFLGLEDIMMTRGIKGVESVLSEMSRLVSKKGLIEISIVEYGDSPEEQVAKEVWKSIGLNCVFLEREWYLRKLIKDNLNLICEEVFSFPKKMTAKQAKEELEFACENTPKTFSSFGVTAISFSQLWDQFCERIEKFGMAYWSTLRVMIFSRL